MSDNIVVSHVCDMPREDRYTQENRRFICGRMVSPMDIYTAADLESARAEGRRDLADTVRLYIDLAHRGLVAQYDTCRNPGSRWPPVEDGLNAIEKIKNIIDAIAEGVNK